MRERDSVWKRRSDGVRVRMHVTPGEEGVQSSVMTLTPFGAENDGAKGEEFVLVGSVPVDE